MRSSRRLALFRAQERQQAIWQVQVEESDGYHEGMWVDVWSTWNNVLEAAYQAIQRRPCLGHLVELEDYESGHIVYEIDLHTYTQTSWSGTERRVRRVLAPRD